MITMEELLALMVRQGGSDLHVTVGSPPRIRIDGSLLPVEHPPLDGEDTRRLATSVLTSDQIAQLDRDLELDCSFGLEGYGRFRVNVFFQQGAVACVMRSLPSEIPNFEMLGMPVAVFLGDVVLLHRRGDPLWLSNGLLTATSPFGISCGGGDERK